MTNTATTPTTIREQLDELGYFITTDAIDESVFDDLPGWLVRCLPTYAAIAITEQSRRVAAITIDDDEGLTIYVFGNAGVLLTSPMTFAADELGARLFLATAAEVARF